MWCHSRPLNESVVSSIQERISLRVRSSPQSPLKQGKGATSLSTPTMAVAFRVDKADDIAKIFAANDELLSQMYHHSEELELAASDMKDVFTMPFAFLPTKKEGGYLLFTLKVPWINEAHKVVARQMRDDGCEVVPICNNTTEECQQILKLDEEDVFTFTKDGSYPDANDDLTKLEDRAVTVICGVMGWKLPKAKTWHKIRDEISEERCLGHPVRTLSEFCDGRRKMNKVEDGVKAKQHSVGDQAD